jgi:hypothetical protein
MPTGTPRPAALLSSPQGGGFFFHFRDFSNERFRRRTPGPPPFSSMNSTPARSNAVRIFVPVPLRPPRGPSLASSLLMVGSETSAVSANCSCDQAKRARAALTCRIDTFSIDFGVISIDTFGIKRNRFVHRKGTSMSHASQPLGNLMQAGHRSCTDGSAREPDLLELWGERPTDAEPDGLSGRPSQPCDRASLKSSASPVCAAHAEFVSILAGPPPAAHPARG